MSTIKEKLEAKVCWFRSLTIPEIAKNPLCQYLRMINIGCKKKKLVLIIFNRFLQVAFR